MENLFTYIFLKFVDGPHGQKNSIREKKSCLGLELESLKKISAETAKVAYDSFQGGIVWTLKTAEA